ncbi:MAG: aspartate--tRNA ligase [Longimicrobiaceae bacterium]
MTDRLPTTQRTTVGGALRAADLGDTVRVAGWVHRRRDLGGLVFVDLRDRSGLVQLSFDPAWTQPDALRAARALSPEGVIEAEGEVARRPEANAELPTGEIEVRVASLRVVTRAEALPIPVYRSPDEELPAEELRLRHRYLDLRRPEMQRNLTLRHRTMQAARRHLAERGFLEIETPLLTRPTPEGARDFLVPSRVHPGEFYALPQSPQLYKQLLMVSGLDRYFQIARCLRDEDLRADRQPEFTQIDLEMSFAGEEDVLAVGDSLIAALWREVLGVELALPLPRLTYREALERYGTDKPDLRFDLPIVDVSDELRGSEWGLLARAFAAGQRVRGMRVPGGAEWSRRELDELQEVARRGGAPGVLWSKRTEAGYAAGPLTRGLAELTDDGPFLDTTGLQPGDLFVAVAGNFRSAPEAAAPGKPTLEPALDELRRHLAARLGMVDAAAHAWVWITDFPLFDWDAEGESLVPSHHPFTMPHPDDAAELLLLADSGEELTPAQARLLYQRPVRSRAYDAVYNGHELASGSVRIHDPALQRAVFHALGLDPEEVRRRFAFLLEAFRFGAPPHAGVAFGVDRTVMLMAGAGSLRDVIAFPKTTTARAAFEDAPTPVDDEELKALHLRAVAPAGGEENWP